MNCKSVSEVFPMISITTVTFFFLHHFVIQPSNRLKIMTTEFAYRPGDWNP